MGLKVAYVEDDEDLRTFCAERFARARYSCETFSSAEPLLKVIAAGRYDVLVLDIKLPGMSGVELLQELRQRGIFTPAIVVTAFVNLEYACKALNAGANYLIEKPFSFDQLKRVVDSVATSPSFLQDCVDRGLAKLRLAKREGEVARLVLKGLTNVEIAAVAGLSHHTVKQYVAQIFQKAQVGSRSEFFAYIFPI
jgi:DNA-binding NarL/FixJ family response regulator